VGGWKRLYNEELHNLCASSNIIRAMKSRLDEIGMAHSTHGREKNAYKILVGKAEWKRPLGRHTHMSENNIKMYLKEIVCEDMDWIRLSQDGDQWRAVVNMVFNFRVL
jgi:hypothetical protein